MTTLAIIILTVLFLFGAPLFVVIMGFAFLGATTAPGGDSVGAIAAQLLTVLEQATGEPAVTLSTIPLFILAGYLMAESRTGQRMVRFGQAALGWLPGGLAVMTIFACAVFTTFTGASGVTIVALGGLIMPSLLAENYPRQFSLGLIAGTGSVGLLFPPALPLFVFGTVYGVQDQLMRANSGFSTDRFVRAGIVPGLVLILVLSALAVGVAVYRRVPRRKFDLREFGASLVIALPELAIPLLVIGALVKGVLIPEIAALTVVYVLVIETLLYRDLKLSALPNILRESMSLCGAIFMILFAAIALTTYFVDEQIPNALVTWISAHVESKWVFLLALNALLLIVGMVMDIFSAIFIVVPLIAPVARQYGVDPFHLGVIFLLNLEVGYLHPPVGLNLFITSYKFQRPVTEVFRATLPFLFAMIGVLLLVTYVPALTVVPEAERRGRLDDLVHVVSDAKRNLQSVKDIRLPDGSTIQFTDCKAKPELEEDCALLFDEVAACRKTAGGAADTPCEAKAIREYWSVVTDDWDAADDDDDAGDDGEGDDAGDGDGGDGAGDAGDGERGDGAGEGGDAAGAGDAGDGTGEDDAGGAGEGGAAAAPKGASPAPDPAE